MNNSTTSDEIIAASTQTTSHNISTSPPLNNRLIFSKTKTGIKDRISDYTILIYGDTKIGKSTWCARADGVYFLSFEGGLSALNVHATEMRNFMTLKQAVDGIVRGDLPAEFKTVAIDTVDKMYDFCVDEVLRKNHATGLNDGVLAFGKGYLQVKALFESLLIPLIDSRYGVIMTSHAKLKTFEEVAKDVEFETAVPSLQSQAYNIVTALTDLIFYATTNEETVNGRAVARRVIKTAPNKYYKAGGRIRTLPETIDLNHAKFKSAFKIAIDELKKMES